MHAARKRLLSYCAVALLGAAPLSAVGHGIKDSTFGENTGSGLLEWVAGSWGSCTAATPRPSCGKYATTYGTESRTVTCRVNYLNGTRANVQVASCNEGLGTQSKPATSRSCSRTAYGGACPPPDDPPPSGGGGGSKPSVGHRYKLEALICGSSDAGYNDSRISAPTRGYRNELISIYRGFGPARRCPERQGFVFWLNDADLIANSNGGNYAAAWIEVKARIRQKAIDNNEAGQGGYANATRWCQERANQLWGGVTVEYVPGSGKECRVVSVR